MKITRFEDIIAWQKAQDLAVEIYKYFGDLRDWGFRDQITKAVVSVSNNIAEGFERGSDAEFIRFLNFSRTSNNEVKSMTYLAARLGYINEETTQQLLKQINEVSRLIYAFIQSIK
ncbi:MAG: four helix bundle protein [Spirosomataceae bacterium]